jgi:hypothetical protein
VTRTPERRTASATKQRSVIRAGRMMLMPSGASRDHRIRAGSRNGSTAKLRPYGVGDQLANRRRLRLRLLAGVGEGLVVEVQGGAHAFKRSRQMRDAPKRFPAPARQLF